MFKVITRFQDQRGRDDGGSAVFYPLYRFAEQMHFTNIMHRDTRMSVIEEWDGDKYVRTLTVFKRK